MKRKATVKRKTKETNINLSLTIDGSGKSGIETGIPFFNHMLTLFSKHGTFDLKLIAKGDIEVDYHHTVEDVGICLGQAFKKALGKKAGIERFGEGKAKVPMDESLAEVSIDISGRPHLSYNIKQPLTDTDKFSIELIEEFFNAFVLNSGMTIHIDLIRGKNSHHIKEAIFKAFAVALSRACQINPRKKGVPSTKGTL